MKREAMLQMLGALVLVAMLSGCGKSGAPGAPAIAATASVSAASTGLANDGNRQPDAPYVDPQLTPIAKADIELYLDVMGAAAARVQHPTAGDVAALHAMQDFNAKAEADSAANAPAEARAQAAQQQLAAKMNAAMQSGDMDKLKALAAQQTTLIQDQQKALHITGPMDDTSFELAGSLSLGHADDVIVRERHLDPDHWDRVVDVIEEVFPPPDAAVGDCGDANCAPELTAEQLLREHEHEAGVARNHKVLASYEQQIRALETVVREGRQ